MLPDPLPIVKKSKLFISQTLVYVNPNCDHFSHFFDYLYPVYACQYGRIPND